MSNPAPLPSLALLGGLGTPIPASGDSPAPLPHLGLLGGLGTGAGTYSLAAARGLYAITGQAAALVHARVLNAEHGTYTLTGQVAILQPSISRVGSPGPLPHIGLMLDRQGGITLTCDPGIYTIVGSEALIDHELDADQGSYAITGQDASLLVHRILTAEGGTYSITGQDAQSSIGGSALVMAADTGTYTITGQDAGLYVGYRLSAEHGFYGVQGQAAELFPGLAPLNDYVLTADAGEYVIVGYDVESTQVPAQVAFAGGFRTSRSMRYVRLLIDDEEVETTTDELAETVKREAQRAANEAVKVGRAKPPQIAIQGDLSRDEKREARAEFRAEFNRDEKIIEARAKLAQQQMDEDEEMLWLI